MLDCHRSLELASNHLHDFGIKAPGRLQAHRTQHINGIPRGEIPVMIFIMWLWHGHFKCCWAPWFRCEPGFMLGNLWVCRLGFGASDCLPIPSQLCPACVWVALAPFCHGMAIHAEPQAICNHAMVPTCWYGGHAVFDSFRLFRYSVIVSNCQDYQLWTELTHPIRLRIGRASFLQTSPPSIFINRLQPYRPWSCPLCDLNL